MIRALFKFAKIPDGRVVVDTTSNTHLIYRELSPFVLPAPPAQNFENLWQFSKVYKRHLEESGLPNKAYYQWRAKGFADVEAHRYPMGRGIIPEYSWWNSEKLGYIEARKKIYAPEYAKNAIKTDSFKILREQYIECNLHNKELILLDYDAYDHLALGMSLIDVINNPVRKMGHAFVLIMMLTDMLAECVNSPTLPQEGGVG